MASTYELENQVNYARDLVRQAQRNGLIDGATAEQHLTRLGVEQAAPAQTVTITVQVTGDATQLRNYNGQVQREVEQALVGNARRVGLTVVAGSTRVALA